MSKEKQIEEMAKIFADVRDQYPCRNRSCAECPYFKVDCSYCEDCHHMEALYNEGYRKQSEGEWVKSKSGLYVCSVCDKTCPYDAQADDISYWKCNFCPNCGAKMKGGAE